MERPLTRTNFKGERTSTATLRKRKAAKLRTAERKYNEQVRRRDKKCRFPLCVCHRFGLALHVAHLEHKGMGGDPTGERSLPHLMILVCIQRHRENPLSIDKGTIECIPLDNELGTNGPVSWWIDSHSLMNPNVSDDTVMLELARESAPGVLVPLTDEQREVLEWMNEHLFRAA